LLHKGPDPQWDTCFARFHRNGFSEFTRERLYLHTGSGSLSLGAHGALRMAACGSADGQRTRRFRACCRG
jgi:hypothetical protein